jgi:SAM-dependent methyltransferase
MPETYICPSCGSSNISVFYEIEQVPVHSVLLLPGREEAVNYPKGTLRLGHCQTCGFIYNTAFQPELHEYSERYEETQGFSPTFNTFSKNLAERLIERYDLHDKDIVEIGCGKGEFLTLLCQLGNNRGTGIDPSYVSERSRSESDSRVKFVTELYAEKHAMYPCDFLCCKMTLEHIDQTAEFLSKITTTTRQKPDTTIFFQVPDVTRILKEAAFWDIYYEHCSYFSPGSLARLFRRQQFDVIDLAREYDDQYLMIEARPQNGQNKYFPELEDDLDMIAQLVEDFSKTFAQTRAFWHDTLRTRKEKGQRTVLWGSGSKGVAFLTTLGITEEIEYTVDINPYKQGTYMAGTGQEIVGPDFLVAYKPDLVIIMNPVYREEIQKDLGKRGLSPEIMTV